MATERQVTITFVGDSWREIAEQMRSALMELAVGTGVVAPTDFTGAEIIPVAETKGRRSATVKEVVQAGAEEPKVETPKEEPKAEEPKDDAFDYEKVVMPAMLEIADPANGGGRDIVTEVLSPFGVSNAKHVPPADRPALMEAITTAKARLVKPS